MPPSVARTPGSAWRAGPIDAFTDSDGTTLRMMPEGTTLTVRRGRLARGEGYAAATPANRQFLARMGAIVRLRALGRFHLHAAAVADPAGRVWILTGENGAGKSTLAYALVRQGWKLIGDDGVIIERTANGITAYPWREPLAVSRALVSAFPELAEKANEPGYRDERDRVPMRFPVTKRGTVAALAILQRGDSDTLERMSQAEVLAFLVKQSVMVMLADGHSAAHLAALQALAMSVPAYRLTHTRRALLEIAATLGGALQ